MEVLDWIMYFGHFAGAIFLEVRVDVCGDVRVILLYVPVSYTITTLLQEGKNISEGFLYE